MTVLGFQPGVLQLFFIFTLIFFNLYVFAKARIGLLQLVIGLFSVMMAFMFQEVILFPFTNFLIGFFGLVQVYDAGVNVRKGEEI